MVTLEVIIRNSISSDPNQELILGKKSFNLISHDTRLEILKEDDSNALVLAFRVYYEWKKHQTLTEERLVEFLQCLTVLSHSHNFPAEFFDNESRNLLNILMLTLFTDIGVNKENIFNYCLLWAIDNQMQVKWEIQTIIYDFLTILRYLESIKEAIHTISASNFLHSEKLIISRLTTLKRLQSAKYFNYFDKSCDYSINLINSINNLEMRVRLVRIIKEMQVDSIFPKLSVIIKEMNSLFPDYFDVVSPIGDSCVKIAQNVLIRNGRIFEELEEEFHSTAKTSHLSLQPICSIFLKNFLKSYTEYIHRLLIDRYNSNTPFSNYVTFSSIIFAILEYPKEVQFVIFAFLHNINNPDLGLISYMLDVLPKSFSIHYKKLPPQWAEEFIAKALDDPYISIFRSLCTPEKNIKKRISRLAKNVFLMTFPEKLSEIFLISNSIPIKLFEGDCSKGATFYMFIKGLGYQLQRMNFNSNKTSGSKLLPIQIKIENECSARSILEVIEKPLFGKKVLYISDAGEEYLFKNSCTARETFMIEFHSKNSSGNPHTKTHLK